MLDVAAQSKLKISTLKDLSRNGFAYSDTRSPSFSTHIENMRRESENGEAHEYVFGPELLEQHHAELLRGLRLPSQFAGFINTQAPLLVNLALGGPGSGVFFHRHDAALNAVFYGTKRWMFYPDLPTSQRGTGADKKSFKVRCLASLCSLQHRLHSAQSDITCRMCGGRSGQPGWILPLMTRRALQSDAWKRSAKSLPLMSALSMRVTWCLYQDCGTTQR